MKHPVLYETFLTAPHYRASCPCGWSHVGDDRTAWLAAASEHAEREDAYGQATFDV